MVNWSFCEKKTELQLISSWKYVLSVNGDRETAEVIVVGRWFYDRRHVAVKIFDLPP